MLAQADALARLPGSDHRPDGPAADFVDLAVDSFARLEGGESGESIVAGRAGLWHRLMHGWPMGDYARLAADELARQGLARHLRVLEIGAGVGGTTVLLRNRLGDGYVRSDVRPQLVRLVRASGAIVAWDFDQPPPPELRRARFDVVFGVNALHCARDRGRTVAWLGGLLAPGGLLLVAEGAPRTRPGVPWALNPSFGMLDGWWDVGGFRSRSEWRALLGTIGRVGSIALQEDSHDLGGVVWARSPTGSGA